MTNSFDGPETLITEALQRALKRLPRGFPLGIERPENSVYGDYATNIALRLAPIRKKSPMAIAEELSRTLSADRKLKKLVARIDIAAPGFLNFILATPWLLKTTAIVARGPVFREGKATSGKKMQVEFISANPTGPLTLANGRGGFIGDTLANVFQACGWKVTREYYVNDAGEQVKKLGASVLRALGYAVPYEDGELYQGAYVKDICEKIPIPLAAIKGSEADTALVIRAGRNASQLMLAEIKRVVRKAGISFDVWFSEQSLHRQGFVRTTLQLLQRKHLVEEREGAVWLKLSAFVSSQEKDRVLVKSSGDPTYVLPDLAYHFEKFRRRRFARVVDIVGADHHGHFRVLKTALRALKIPEPELVMVQIVRLTENGEEVRMSKRAGTFATLEELLAEVGVDVARWFFISRAPETHMDFDLAAAREQSEKNPVYYVQYAHARCASLLRRAQEGRGTAARRGKAVASSLFHASEEALMKALVRLPDVVVRIGETKEVHRLPHYATEVAAAFSAFYRDCPVLSENAQKTRERLTLVAATKRILATTLGLMGIRAPEQM